MSTDDSVSMSLRELFQMETDRRVEEATARERARAEAIARREAERRAREKAVTRAREEERRELEEERADESARVEARLRALREELGEVRTQREEIRLQVAALASEPAGGRRGSWIAGVMAAASLVAAVTATAVAWPRDEPQMTGLGSETRVAAAQPPERVAEAPTATVETAEAAPAREAEPPSEPAVSESPSRPHSPAHRPHVRPRPRPSRDPIGDDLDFGAEHDVLSDDFLRRAGN